jgi:hypothetical protein
VVTHDTAVKSMAVADGMLGKGTDDHVEPSHICA